MVTAPIFKDTYYRSEVDIANYKIMLEGATIFNGKAYKYPGREYMDINVNKICSNYLTSDIEEFLTTPTTTSSTITHYNAQRVFNFYLNNTNVEDYRFYLDYSYDFDFPVTGDTIVLSQPVNGHFVPGMVKIQTVRNSTSLSSDVISTANVSSVSGLGYTTQVACSPYVLIYLNSYGGWDSLAIEGKVIKKDAINSYTTDKAFNNNTLQFETNKYVNEIKTSYELHTGYLTDAQAANIAKNLIGSLKVYLQNVDEGWIKPVIISDNTAIYNTYANNQQKPVAYTINVVESQAKTRKA